MALVVLSMVIDAALFYNKIHAGVSIEGQSISGLTQDEAVAKINDYLARSQDQPIDITGGGKTWQVKPSQLGTKVDVAGAVATAMNVTRKSNFVVDQITKLKLYFGARDLPLQGTVDTASLDTFIGQVATALDQPAVNAGLRVTGSSVAPVAGKNGLIVDQETFKKTLTQTLLSLHSTGITVPMVVDKPDIEAEDNATLLAEAKTILSAPVTLTWGDKTWTFTPEELATYLIFPLQDPTVSPATASSTSTSSTTTTLTTTTTTSSESASSTSVPPSSATSTSMPTYTTPFLSAEKMAARLQEIATQTTATPVDASLKVVNKKIHVVPGVEGVVLDPVATAEALTTAALSTTNRTAEVAGTKQEPTFTTEQVEAMGIKDQLSTFTLSYVGTADRQSNVRLTVQYLLQGGKCFLKPGQEFSFKDTVGPRTKERGFKKAYGIVPGITLEDVYGGGICQVSTILFNTVLLAGLKVTERVNHTIYLDHYPRGRDATVTDEGPDFRFVNNTDHYIWLTGKSDGKTTTLTIYGTSDGRKVSLSVSPWYAVWGPYTSTSLDPSLPTGASVVVDKGQTAKMCMLTRTVKWPGGKVVKDSFESNYKHRWRIVRVGTGPTTTVTHTATTSTPTTTGP